MLRVGLCRNGAEPQCLVPRSVAVCRFSNTGEDWYVLVGVAKDLILNPRSVAGGFVYTYKLVNSGEKLEFLHKVRGEREQPLGALSVAVTSQHRLRSSCGCYTLETVPKKTSHLPPKSHGASSAELRTQRRPPGSPGPLPLAVLSNWRTGKEWFFPCPHRAGERAALFLPQHELRELLLALVYEMNSHRSPWHRGARPGAGRTKLSPRFLAACRKRWLPRGQLGWQASGALARVSAGLC